jgi:CheY-like chemotaxis protein
MLTDATRAAKSTRILVVDDQPPMAAALTSFLRTLGYEARAVSSGEAALSEIFRDPPSLVLLDLKLDGSSGSDVLRVLRSDPRFATLPVVLCSAQDSLTAENVRELGAQDFVQKSEVFERLAAVIARELPEPKSRPAAGV